MNLSEIATLVFLPLAILSDCSQLKSEFNQPVQCTPIEVVKIASDIKTLDDLPMPIKKKITTDAFGSAFIAWLFIGLIVYAVKSFITNRRRGWL